MVLIIFSDIVFLIKILLEANNSINGTFIEHLLCAKHAWIFVVQQPFNLKVAVTVEVLGGSLLCL